MIHGITNHGPWLLHSSSFQVRKKKKNTIFPVFRPTPSLTNKSQIVLAIFFSILAFSYWRQLLDPTSSANAARAPSAQVRTGGFPSHYTPAYNTNYPDYVSSVPNLPYQPYDQRYGYTEHDDPFAPPYEVDGKPPGYTGAGTAGDFKGENKSTDAFVNSDGQSLREERDVTSGRGTSH